MFIEALGVLLAAAEAIDNNDTSRQQMADQKEIARIKAHNDEMARKHETKMTIISGVFDLLQTSMQSDNNNKNK